MASEPLALTTGRHRVLATPKDRVRQVVVLAGALVAVAGAAVGSGAAGGTPVAEAADGALAADATVVAPAGPAFGIWSVIYLGLLAVAVHQALPRHATNPRLRATSWWVLASMLLNAAWIGVVQAGWLWASVVVIAALVAVLCVVSVRYVHLRPARGLEAWLYQGTIGLYLGWVCVATLADVAATLAAADVGGLGLGETTWGVVLVGLGAAVVVAFSVYAHTRGVLIVATGIAAAWGLAWIAYGRFQGPLVDETVAIAASTAAAIALSAPLVTVVSRPRPAPRRGATVVVPSAGAPAAGAAPAAASTEVE